MVIAHRVIFCTYGFWLPNDPRGSNSDVVWADHLKPFGVATMVSDRLSHAKDSHDRALRAAAKRALLFEPVRLSGVQARAVGQGFAKQVTTSGFTIYACAILSQHIHMVVRSHHYRVEQVVNLLKGAATRELVSNGLFERGSNDRPIWSAGLRKVFCSTAKEVRLKIAYVRGNPSRDGHKPQAWSFVVPFDDGAR